MFKRKLALIPLAVFAVSATTLFAAELSSIVVRPSAMKQGEVKTLTEKGRQVTIVRRGEFLEVRIEGATSIDRLEVTRDGDDLRIASEDSPAASSSQGRSVSVIGPGGREISIGLPRSGNDEGKESSRRGFEETWFVCPKDGALLKVTSQTKADLRCPVDGAVMERRKGKTYSFWIGES